MKRKKNEVAPETPTEENVFENAAGQPQDKLIQEDGQPHGEPTGTIAGIETITDANGEQKAVVTVNPIGENDKPALVLEGIETDPEGNNTFNMSVKPEPTADDLESFWKSWSDKMRADGWRRGFGTKVSETSKIHPLLVPYYNMLTAGQKADVAAMYYTEIVDRGLEDLTKIPYAE